MKGLFITFEGPDGSGKSTQLRLLAHYLEEEGYPVIQTREPGGTAISDQIRQIILDPDHKQISSETEVLLYAASRAQHVREKIIPALEENKIVLCDRFVDASIAYQGYGLGLGIEHITLINQYATGGLQPHRTYLIDIDPEQGRARMSHRKEKEFKQDFDRIEQKEIEYHQRVREGFKQIAKQSDRILEMNGMKTAEKLHREIVVDMGRWLETKYRRIT